MKGWACCVLICHQQKRTFAGWRTSSRDFAYFRVSYVTFYVNRGSGQARVYPRRWLFLSSRAKAFTLQGRHRRFVGDSAFHTSLRGAPLLVGEQQKKWDHQILQKVQNLMPRDYIPSCTILYMLLYSSTHLLIYCCFHLTSGANTAAAGHILFTETGSASSCYNQCFEKSLLRKSTRCLI